MCDFFFNLLDESVHRVSLKVYQLLENVSKIYYNSNRVTLLKIYSNMGDGSYCKLLIFFVGHTEFLHQSIDFRKKFPEFVEFTFLPLSATYLTVAWIDDEKKSRKKFKKNNIAVRRKCWNWRRSSAERF